MKLEIGFNKWGKKFPLAIDFFTKKWQYLFRLTKLTDGYEIWIERISLQNEA